MPDSAVDPAAMTDAEKLNFLVSQMAPMTDQQTSLLAQVTTINNRLETHDKRLAALEKAPVDPAAGATDLDLSGGGTSDYTSAGGSSTMGTAGKGDVDTGVAGRCYGGRVNDGGPDGGFGSQGGRGGRRGGDFYGRPQHDGG
jgi:hypothetical protein